MLWLEIRNAGGNLPAITAPMWATAAGLLSDTVELAEALAVAGALHAPRTGDKP